MATQKNKSTLTETGKKVGKALARSSHTVEEAGQKMKATAEKFVKKAAGKAEKAGKTVESAVDTVKKEVNQLSRKKASGTTAAEPPLFKPSAGMSVEGQIGFLAGDIFAHLSKNGPTPVAEITSAMKNRGSLPLLGAAFGWLAREAKIAFSQDGTTVSLL
jgi:hypothetical protein